MVMVTSCSHEEKNRSPRRTAATDRAMQRLLVSRIAVFTVPRMMFSSAAALWKSCAYS